MEKHTIHNAKESDLFYNIDEENLLEIFDIIEYKVTEYGKGEIIAIEGDTCFHIGLIIGGTVRVERIYPSGNTIVMKKLIKGEVFGEALVISNTSKYPATIISDSKSKVLFISKNHILKICSLNEKILENFITILSSKIIMLNKKVKSISLKTISQKVADYLINQCKTQKSKTIILNESKENIASYIGIPRPSLSRELKNLKEKGIIDYDRKEVFIININNLEKILLN